LVGIPPFRGESKYTTFQRIRRLEYVIPDRVSDDARDLISKLLVLDPVRRLGHEEFADDYASIRNHSFFAPIDNWDTLPFLAPAPWPP
jgi:hypothetical protein